MRSRKGCLSVISRRRQNYERMSRLNSLFGVLVLLQAIVPSFAAIVKTNNEKVLSLELVPHHAQKTRRLQEYVVDHNSSNNMIRGETSSSSFTKEQLEEWRRHCPRFQLLDAQDDQSRHLGASFAAEQVAGLFQGYGTHYADLWCGTPPQRQTVIVDTGSGVTAFPCSACDDCGVPKYHIDQLFDESKSSSYRVLPCAECLRGHCDHSHCRMGQSYQEGSSWTAHEGEDSCYVGGLHNKPLVNTNSNDSNDIDPYMAPNFAFKLKFGCQTRITGLFKTQLADGIMGMDIAKAAFWEQMYAAGKIENKAFSLCYSRSPTASRDGTNAGAMSLGGSDERLHQSEMVYSVTDGEAGFYIVHLRKAYLRAGGGGDSALSTDPNIKIIPLNLPQAVLNKGNVIVDSGTTDTYFHRGINAEFQAAFRQLMGKRMDHSSAKMTAEEVDAMPTILFQMKGDIDLNKEIADRHTGPVPGLAGSLDPEYPYDVILAIPPSHYMEYDEEDGKYTARFYSDESRGSVLGANAMMGHDVLFDVENGKVGWAESDCDYRKLVDTYYDGKIPDPPSNDSRAGKKLEPSDESRFKPENKDTQSIIENAPKAFCTKMSCQVTLGLALVGTIVLVGVRLARGSWKNAAEGYGEVELSAAELEMQTPPMAMNDEDESTDLKHGEFT